MSSKRRQERRHPERSQHLANSTPGKPAFSKGKAHHGKNNATGRKTLSPKGMLVLATLVLLAGLAIFAATGMKGAKAGNLGATNSPASPPASTLAGPKIQFASQVYDFGKLNGDQLVNCLFVFTNVGKTLLELSEVSPSCGCLKLGDWSRQVAPGQTGSISIQYNSRLYTGHFGKSVHVTCNDPSQSKFDLQVQGTIWRPLEITPPSAALNLNAETPSNATTVRIISHLDEPLFLSDLECTPSALAVELQTNQPGKEYHLLVKTMPPFPTNNLQGQIKLKTSTTNQPVLTINAWANVQPILMAVPFQIKLPAPPLTNSYPTTVWVQNHGTNLVALSEAAVNAKDVEAQIKEDLAGRQFSVQVKFPPGFEAAPGAKVELSIKSSHPLFPVLKVPVVQAPRPAPVTPAK